MRGGRQGPGARAFTIALGLVYLLPLLWIALTAFKSDRDVLSRPNAVVFTPTLAAFSDVLDIASTSVLTSLKISVATTLLVLVVAVPAAYALARRVSDGWARVSALVLGLFLVLQMVPQPMAVIPLYGILADWRLVGSLTGLVLADVALLVPFGLLLLRPFVLAIPREVFEAAQIDGAGGVRTFLGIVVPLLVNGIATVGRDRLHHHLGRVHLRHHAAHRPARAAGQRAARPADLAVLRELEPADGPGPAHVPAAARRLPRGQAPPGRGPVRGCREVTTCPRRPTCTA